MLKVSVDVIGIFHSLTVEVERMGPKEQIVRNFINEGGFWNDDRFTPWGAVVGVTVGEEDNDPVH